MNNLIEKLNKIPSIVGIMDSGIGGISALNVLNGSGVRHVFYVADTAYLPYGEKSYEVLLHRASYIINFLLSHNIFTIVIACHTLSSTVLPELERLYPHVDFIDLLAPIVSYAVSVTRNNIIGVLATYNTVESKRFPTMIHAINSDIHVVQQACPDFVTLLEAPELETKALDDAVDRYLKSALEASVDTLILGCTHYAFLSDRIFKRLENSYEVVSAQSCIQKALRHKKEVFLKIDFFVSGSLELFRSNASRVLSPELKINFSCSRLS